MENLDSQSAAATAETSEMFSTVKKTTEKAAPLDAALELAETHPDFIETLANGPIPRLPTLEPRQYQTDCLENLRQAYLDGVISALAEIGTGAGKTAIALNLIAGIPGKVLWLAPSNAALSRAVDETENLRLNKKCQTLNGKPIDPDTDIVFSTVGMLNYSGKFEQFDPEEFSLIIFDEGHHSMGKATRRMLEHFQAYHLYLTATPEMCAGHLHKFARPVFRYSSEALIHNDNFPFWTLRRYEVTGEKLNEARVIGDNYALAAEEENQVLNMPHRYAITLQVLQKTVPAGEKTISFLPSVAASRKFVEDIVAKHPELKGKVVHVDGKMDKRVVRAIAKEFRSGRILAVCCNDLFTESLDIPDIKHVVLADPCCSPRVLLQRIGRGARPAKGKTHLTIHDVISTVANLEDARKGTAPLTVAAALKAQTYAPDIVLNGPNKDKVLFEKSGGDGQSVSFVDNTQVETEDLPFHERMIDMTFMSNPDSAFALFKLFAREHFQTAVENLILYPDNYTSIKPQPRVRLAYADQHETIITFRDAVTAVRLYRLQDKLLQLMQEDLDTLCSSFNDRVKAASKTEQKKAKTESAETPKSQQLLQKIIRELKEQPPVPDYYRDRSEINKVVLLQSQHLMSKNPKTLYGMGTWQPDQEPRNQALQEYFETSDAYHHDKQTGATGRTYPFRVKKHSNEPDDIVRANVGKIFEESQKVDSNNELICSLLNEPDTYFLYVAQKFPQMYVWFELVSKALRQGTYQLYFSPKDINLDMANFLLFVGIIAGDFAFESTSSWPEFHISESHEHNAHSSYLVVSLNHLRPGQPPLTTKPPKSPLELVNADTPPEEALRRIANNTQKEIDLPAYLEKMETMSEQVLIQSKNRAGNYAPRSNVFRQLFHNPDTFLSHSPQATNIWRGLVKYMDASSRLSTEEKRKNNDWSTGKSYDFRVQKSSYAFAPEVVTRADQFNNECNKITPNLKLQREVFGEPDTVFLLTQKDYPQLQVYFRMVHDALSEGIPALYFTPEQINSDLSNFLLFIGTLSGDHDFEDTKVWPEFFIEDVMTSEGPFLTVNLKHLRLNTSIPRQSRSRKTKIAKDTPNLIALEKAVTDIKPVRWSRYREKMSKVFSEVIENSLQYKSRFETVQSEMFSADFLTPGHTPTPRMEKAWQGIREYFMTAQVRRAKTPPKDRKKYPFRVEINHPAAGRLVPSREIIRAAETLNTAFNTPHDKVDDVKCVHLLDQPDVYFAYMASNYPQLSLYFKLVAEALSKDIKVLTFSAKQINSDPENFLLFLGTMSGDCQFMFENPVFPEFWISDGRHGEGSIVVSLKHLDLQIAQK